VFAALNECVCGAFSAQNGRVCGFVLIVQLVEGHFCLLNGASFVYLVCLWALLRGKTNAFVMSFGRVWGVKRVCLRCFFSTKRTCLRRVCGFRVDSAVSSHFCLSNGTSFVYLACLWTLLRRKTGAFTMSFVRVCDVKRVFAALFRRKTGVFATRLLYTFDTITAKQTMY